MAGKQQGQILYLGGSTGAQNSPGGSLSTRFQKLSQARSSGIIVVNQPVAAEGSRPGRGLGLGYKTGSNPSGQRGSRMVSNRNAGSEGIHTAGGLARAMQERGAGVSDAFLLAPALTSASASRAEGAGRNKKVRGVGGGAPITTNNARGSANNQNSQATRHKALVLGGRPGRRQAGNGGGAQQQQQPQQQQQQQQKGGKAGKAGRGGAANGPAAAAAATVAGGKRKKGAAAAAAAAGGKGAKAGKGGKGGKAKPASANAQNLDSELSEYMMKNEQTAASLLDNDLDTYMADKPQDGTW